MKQPEWPWPSHVGVCLFKESVASATVLEILFGFPPPKKKGFHQKIPARADGDFNEKFIVCFFLGSAAIKIQLCLVLMAKNLTIFEGWLLNHP